MTFSITTLIPHVKTEHWDLSVYERLSDVGSLSDGRGISGREGVMKNKNKHDSGSYPRHGGRFMFSAVKPDSYAFKG